MLSNADAKQCKCQTMLSNANVKQCKCQTMLSTYMLDKYTEHAEHILCTYLQYADYGQCIRRATLPIGVYDGGKEKKKRNGGAYCLELPRPTVGS